MSLNLISLVGRLANLEAFNRQASEKLMCFQPPSALEALKLIRVPAGLIAKLSVFGLLIATIFI